MFVTEERKKSKKLIFLGLFFEQWYFLVPLKFEENRIQSIVHSKHCALNVSISSTEIQTLIHRIIKV